MKTWPIIFTLILISACQIAGNEEEPIDTTPKLISFATLDGWQITGTHYPEVGTSIILLHQLDSDHAEWSSFARQLQREGYNVLAIDFRGHGRTKKDGQAVSWERFSEREFNKMANDVQEAQRFLNADNITLIGSSIGANVALNYAAGNSQVGALILLSPGDDYRGVTTTNIISDINQPTLIIASEEDTYAASSSQRLFRSARNANIITLNHAGHGVAMFDETDLLIDILAWLEDNFPVLPAPIGNATNVTALS